MSKAAFSRQKSPMFQRAVLFAMINPQPNGAGFAGVRSDVGSRRGQFENATELHLRVRGQGDLTHWKVVLTQDGEEYVTYQNVFEVQKDGEQFEVVRLRLDEFKPYRRGRPMPDEPALNMSEVATLGLQAFGGVHEEFKQSGT